MIPTRPASRSRAVPATDPRSVRTRRVHEGAVRALALALLLPLALGACTNSKLVVGPLYNRLDDQVRKEFEKLGDFDEHQKALFETAVGTAHVWHRRQELPAYAALMSEVAGSIARPGQTSHEDVTRWAKSAAARARAARACHPVNFSLELMQSLSDEQVDAIEQRLTREREENRKKYLSRTREERREHRQKKIEKWAGRIGLDFTANQRAMLRTTLEKQISLRRQYFRLSDAWREELFGIARDQEAPDYAARMSAQIDALWTLLETAYPDEWQRNRELWRDFGYRFVESMNAEQREVASAWLGKMAETLMEVSRDEPSFTPGDDPSAGCLVETAAPETTDAETRSHG